MAHIIDSQTAVDLALADAGRDSEHLSRELSRQRILKHMGDTMGSSLDPQAQLGRTMEPYQLEALIRLHAHGLVFKVHPERTWIKNVFRAGQDLDYLFSYENRTMPEWDIRYATERWVPDPACKQLNRADVRSDKPVTFEAASDLIKKHGLQGAVQELLKREVNSDKVGYVRVVELGGTAVRGWRSVLARLVELKFITSTVAEDVAARYGSSTERASWASHLGKQNLATQG